MSNMENDVEQYERREAQWEVSSFDVANHPIYIDWAERNVKGMLSENIDTMVNDVTNIHFAFVRPTRDVMDKILHAYGLDLNESIERQVCCHRTFSGTRVNGERYVGKQRTDDEWKAFKKRNGV